MGPMAQTLAAISAGAVFMGANTYIGNAPNFMVKAIAGHLGVKMPGFFGFMAWSAAFLLPGVRALDRSSSSATPAQTLAGRASFQAGLNSVAGNPFAADFHVGPLHRAPGDAVRGLLAPRVVPMRGVGVIERLAVICSVHAAEDGCGRREAGPRWLHRASVPLLMPHGLMPEAAIAEFVARGPLSVGLEHDPPRGSVDTER